MRKLKWSKMLILQSDVQYVTIGHMLNVYSWLGAQSSWSVGVDTASTGALECDEPVIAGLLPSINTSATIQCDIFLHILFIILVIFFCAFYKNSHISHLQLSVKTDYFAKGWMLSEIMFKFHGKKNLVTSWKKTQSSWSILVVFFFSGSI